MMPYSVIKCLISGDRTRGHLALFLPDVVEKAVADGVFDVETGQKVLLALRPRLPIGFVEHSLRRLEGVL